MASRLWNVVFDDDCCDDCEDRKYFRRPRWIKSRSDYFEDLDEVDFTTRFRLSKKSALDLLEVIEEKIEFRSDKNCAVAPMTQLLLTLRYYATGSNQMTIADFCGVSKSTAHRIIHRVSCAIASLRPNFVKFPNTDEEIKKNMLEFYKVANFPRVVGAMDCTHIRIKSPGGVNAEVHRNRKGYFSINTQIICDCDMKIIDIVCRWPGSSHDQHIFNSCRRHALFESGLYKDAVLVVDGGYRYRPYLMAPLENPSTPVENLYNESQIRTRNVVERLFGIWKRRFPVLALGVNVNLENVFPIIVATGVLHNILRDGKESLPPDDPSILLPAPWQAIIEEGNIPPRIHENPEPRVIYDIARQELINKYFSNLLTISQSR